MRWGQWPIIILRAVGEMTGNTGYDEIRLMGRELSAIADILSVLLLISCSSAGGCTTARSACWPRHSAPWR